MACKFIAPLIGTLHNCNLLMLQHLTAVIPAEEVRLTDLGELTGPPHRRYQGPGVARRAASRTGRSLFPPGAVKHTAATLSLCRHVTGPRLPRRR